MKTEREIVTGYPPATPEQTVGSVTEQPPIAIDIYVAQHCANCAYAHEVAAEIRQHFPHVQLRLIDMGATTEAIPEAVFATPTYLLNGRVWSLGNPSPAKVHETLTNMSTN